jgi:hypothetical protein
MGDFDPRNPPAWVRRLMSRAQRAPRREPGAAGPRGDREHAADRDFVGLGHGTFVAPLPAGWTLHPGRPFQGRIRARDGYVIEYRLDSYEDPAAARGEARILDYLDEPGLRDRVRRPRDALANVLVAVAASGRPDAEIVWKRLDPLGATHVRELVLRCRLGPALAPQRLAIARAVGEWVNLGGFAPEPTALDRVAHSAMLERANFEDTLLMRVPRAWNLEVDGEKDGRKVFAVDEPEGRETIRASSQYLRIAAGDDPGEFLADTTDALWNDALGPARARWLLRRREELPEGDVLMTTANEEVEDGEPLRRLTWLRYAIRDAYLVWAAIHLVTAVKFVDEPAQVESEAMVDREVRNALLLRPGGG